MLLITLQVTEKHIDDTRTDIVTFATGLPLEDALRKINESKDAFNKAYTDTKTVSFRLLTVEITDDICADLLNAFGVTIV